MAISAEVTIDEWSVERILAGPRLRTRSRYAEAPVARLRDAGFELLPAFVAPHYSVLFRSYDGEEAKRLLDALGEPRKNPYYVRRTP